MRCSVYDSLWMIKWKFKCRIVDLSNSKKPDRKQSKLTQPSFTSHFVKLHTTLYLLHVFDMGQFVCWDCAEMGNLLTESSRRTW